ncbi:MAG: polysulfide reductase NrfD [Planctomycetes bacterium]|nr:polysulfide reductase NrfD [Planctomycetota bacterium]
MGAHVYSVMREPLVVGKKTLHEITQDVCQSIEGKPSLLWWLGFLTSGAIATAGVATMLYQMYVGVGTWGLNKTVGWGFDITNFVFWIGIGHAGTLISAVLFLFRQKWRTSINRSAEAMTLFAVLCALIYPTIHMGRPWIGPLWIAPYPNLRGPLWVNFRSPLLWDVFAISTYFTISLCFWYIGLVPDLATVRDRAKHWLRKVFYGTLSLGWNGSVRNWNHYEVAYMIFAGLSTPLVFSVHTIVSMDFATSVIPGWHTTIFPPYFVAGAIFSGFAMVLTLLLIARKTMRLEAYINEITMDNMAKIVLLTGSLVGLAYGTEFFVAWYSGSIYEGFAFINRATGPFAWSYWIMVSCNVISPQILWFKKLRRNPWVLFVMSIFVNIGMWFERFVIIVTSLHRDYLPSSWAYYTMTWVEYAELIGTFGIFFFMFFVFIRFLPGIAFGEVKGVNKYARHDSHGHAHAEVKHG